MTATDVITDFSPPDHIIQSEMAVAGSAMESTKAAETLAVIVRPHQFRRPAHGLIYGATLALAERGDPVGLVAVMAELTRAGDLGNAGGANYLHDCQAAAAAPHAIWHARRVAADFARRTMAAALTTSLDYTTSDGFDLETGFECVRAMVEAAAAPAQTDGVQPLDDLLMEVLDSLEREAERGIPTPWADLNRLIGGLAAGEACVIAARTGVGKSVAGLGLAAHAAIHHGLPVLLCSVEMNRHQVMLRLIAAEGRVPLHALVIRELSDRHWERVNTAKERIMGAPLVIDDTPGCSLAHIRARLRGMARTAPARLLIVDYLQLLTSDGRAENRQTEVSALSRGLKLIAGEFEIPVVAMAQLNRKPEQRAGKRPELSDLRESGSIEQDASVVILLHRDDANGQETERAGEIDLIVAKNRNGPPATITCAWQGEFARIMDMTQDRPRGSTNSNSEADWTPSSVLGGQK